MSTINGGVGHGVTFGGSGTYSSPLTITGSGSVIAGSGNGVYSAAPGVTLVNAGSIYAQAGQNAAGVVLAGGGTIVEAGYIRDNSGIGIALGGSGANRLVLDPGYRLVGSALGSTVASASNTLELAAGATAGTVGGIGTRLTNFGTITVDDGAQWTLAGNTLGSGVTVTNLGTLTDTGALTNAGLITAVGTALNGTSTANITNSGTIAGTGASGIGVASQGGIVIDSGTITGGSGTAVLFDGGINAVSTLELLPGYSLGGGNAVGGTASGAVNKLTLGSAASVGTISGLGTRFINFSPLYVNSGAQWVFAGGNTIGSGVRLNNNGGTLSDAGTLINAGAIASRITLASGSYLDITAQGNLTASVGYAVYSAAPGVTLVNAGSIYAQAGQNAAGVVLAGGGTIVEAGYIRDNSGIGIALGGSGANRLVLDPGYRLVGSALGSTVASASNTLELAAGATAGTVGGIGTRLTNFGTITVDDGAQWTLGGNTAGLAATITGLEIGDTIDLTGFVASTETYTGSGLVLGDSGGDHVTVGIQGDFSTANFSIANGGGGTVITLRPGHFGATDPLMTNTSGALVFDQVVGGRTVFTAIGGLGAEWEFDGAGDNLLGDGNSGFLIRDTGSVAPGTLDVGEVANNTASFTPIGGLGLEWQFEGVADFLGTGQSEFLIRNAGSVEPGALDLGQVISGSVQYTRIAGLGSEWQFDGTGDFLRDGRNGFLIRNTGSAEPGALDVGEVVNGVAQYTPVGGVGTEWLFEGTGDFLGDGRTGFLIWNSGSADPGAMAIGEVVNGQLQFTDVGGVGPEWQFTGTGNYIDSNKTDFLLRNTNSGALVVGSVSGSLGNATVNFTTVGGIGAEWAFHNTSSALVA